MYHPTTRVLTALELLQSRSRMSGAELAERLEVDRRTVRRYMTMLQDLGVPVESVYLDHLPAYDFYLRAKMTPEQWRQIEALVNDDWKRAEADSAWPIWIWTQFGPKPAWWNPTGSNAGAYVVSRDGRDAALKYENDYVFYWSRGDPGRVR